jgi:hypothetical protein
MEGHHFIGVGEIEDWWEGEYHFGDGMVYTGTMHKLQFHGQGKLLSKGQVQYEGEYKHGAYSGLGIYNYLKEKRQYIG